MFSALSTVFKNSNHFILIKKTRYVTDEDATCIFVLIIERKEKHLKSVC